MVVVGGCCSWLWLGVVVVVIGQGGVAVGEAQARGRDGPARVPLAVSGNHVGPGRLMLRCRAGGGPWTGGRIPRNCVMEGCAERGQLFGLLESHVHETGKY